MLTEWAEQFTNSTHRFVVCSGGGPGIMEAANRGAADAGGKTVGLNIGLPFEQFPNPYITPELSFEFHYFFMRKFWFAYLAKALVVFPGGFGTLDELMEILTLTQTQKLAKKMTVLLYGSEYWKEIINFDALVKYGMISPRGSEPVPVRRRSGDRVRNAERPGWPSTRCSRYAGDAGDLEIHQPAEAGGGVRRRMFSRKVAPGIEIRLFELKDAEAVFAVVDRNRAYLREWLPWVDFTASAEDLRQLHLRCASSSKRPRDRSAASGSTARSPAPWAATRSTGRTGIAASATGSRSAIRARAS